MASQAEKYSVGMAGKHFVVAMPVTSKSLKPLVVQLPSDMALRN